MASNLICSDDIQCMWNPVLFKLLAMCTNYCSLRIHKPNSNSAFLKSKDSESNYHTHKYKPVLQPIKFIAAT